jgi:hypothetical protein
MPSWARGVDLLVAASLIATTAVLAVAQSGPMTVQSGDRAVPHPMSHFAPTREAYTADHRLLVKLLSVPSPIPYEKYFTVRLGVYDGQNPAQQLSDVRLQVSAGMSHGLGQGFAHGMQSAAKIEVRDGVAVVSGMFFHMTGAWTMEVNVHVGGEEGTAYFQLPCCGQ